MLRVDFDNNCVVAAEILYNLGERDIATSTLLDVLDYPEDKARCHALNTIVHLEEDGADIRDAVARMYPEKQYTYSLRIVEYLHDKWNL